MNVTNLTLKSLYLLEGLSDDFQNRMDAAVLDCHQNPLNQKARTVKIEIELTPDEQDMDRVVVRPVVTSKMPSRSLAPIRAIRTRNNQLRFNFEDDSLSVDGSD